MEHISFGTDGWRATLDTFTDDRVRIVGQAVADYLHAEGFAESLAEVLAGNGFDVILPERDRPTPLVATAVVNRELAGALMITASHNPAEYNGVKFIPSDGAPALPSVTDAVAARLTEPDLDPMSEWGTIKRVDFRTPHAEETHSLVETDLTGLTVVYDAMHGSGRGVTDALLREAGAEVHTIRVERDPTFGGSPPEPSGEHLDRLIDAVEKHDADIGIANDGDADRVGFVTPDRGHLDENLFYAVLYEYLLESDSGPAVRTVSTTFLIDRIAEAHGQSVVETAVGFKWVANAMKEHDALVGGEESGGFSIRGHVREKDGVLMGLLGAAVTAAEPIDDRVNRLLETHGDIVADKISVDCPDAEKTRVIDSLEDNLPETVDGHEIADVVSLDGFKLLLDDGSWILVRPSGTEPKMRVYAEASSQEHVETLLQAGRDLIEPLI